MFQGLRSCHFLYIGCMTFGLKKTPKPLSCGGGDGGEAIRTMGPCMLTAPQLLRNVLTELANSKRNVWQSLQQQVRGGGGGRGLQKLGFGV